MVDALPLFICGLFEMMHGRLRMYALHSIADGEIQRGWWVNWYLLHQQV